MKHEKVIELIKWCTEKIKEFPNLKIEIKDFLDLALLEIEDGASLENEINLCIADVEELIKENL